MRSPLSLLCVLSVLSLSACRAPAQSAAQRSDADSRLAATAGGDARQETHSATDQRQQQLADSAPVAPQARDVGAMTVTARAEFHDLGSNQLALDTARDDRRWRLYAAIALSVVGFFIACMADNLLGEHPHHKLIVILCGLGVAVAPWVPLLLD